MNNREPEAKSDIHPIDPSPYETTRARLRLSLMDIHPEKETAKTPVSEETPLDLRWASDDLRDD